MSQAFCLDKVVGQEKEPRRQAGQEMGMSLRGSQEKASESEGAAKRNFIFRELKEDASERYYCEAMVEGCSSLGELGVAMCWLVMRKRNHLGLFKLFNAF